jgi:thioredoxin reductase
LLIVGAGPAGVATGVMASSLRMTTAIVEAEQVGSKPLAIVALENAPAAGQPAQRSPGEVFCRSGRFRASAVRVSCAVSCAV